MFSLSKHVEDLNEKDAIQNVEEQNKSSIYARHNAE